jgi:hypothetical protein
LYINIFKTLVQNCRFFPSLAHKSPVFYTNVSAAGAVLAPKFGKYMENNSERNMKMEVMGLKGPAGAGRLKVA